ncbi:hypothetical protein LTR85_008337 [Meristemomyces frigidus]|nr:hypothetical protein LTR85_008337 [Meristemomyces frigidus]
MSRTPSHVSGSGSQYGPPPSGVSHRSRSNSIAPNVYPAASKVNTVRNFPSSQAGDHAPSRAPSYAGSRAPSHAPTQRSTLSRSNSARPSESRALGPIAPPPSAFPSVQEITESLPSGSEGGRIRITRTQETTRVTESIEIGGSSSSGRSLRRHAGTGDLRRPRHMSIDSDRDCDCGGVEVIRIYPDGMFGEFGSGGFAESFRF